MRRPRTTLLLPLAAAMLLSASCATGGEVRANADIVDREVKKARAQGAYKCAPKDLAVAEANLDFGLEELDEGRFTEANRHVRIAHGHSASALENSKKCVPVKVVLKKSEPPPNPCAGDADNDGVNDCEDKCPNDAGPRANNGCPYGDSDGDGLKDPDDDCPNVAGPVENKGCPWPDRDGDGILDKDDRCPDEPGVPEEQGCPPKKTYTLVVVNREKGLIEIKQKVHFEFNKAVIVSDSFPLLKEVAEALKDNEGMRVRVEGHTDDRGSVSYNLKLSDSRANAVRDHMIRVNGIDSSRLAAKGYGKARPVDSNRTEKGRANNRRVEFHILKEGEPDIPSE